MSPAPVNVSENPTFKLIYFDVKGLSEPIRYLFAYGGQKYEDVRVKDEDWTTLKPTTPLGQLPILEIDGRRSHQSIPIARYLAKRVGLAGSNDWENLIIDTVVDTVNEFRTKIATVAYETNEEIKAQKLIPLNTETIPFYLEKLETLVKENDGHLALSKLTWADLYFTASLDYILYLVKEDVLVKYPKLRGLVTAVNELAPIKAWIKKRPVTDL